MINICISILILVILDSCSLLDKIMPAAPGMKIGLQAGDNEYKIHSGSEQNINKNAGTAIEGDENLNTVTGSKQVIIQSRIINMESSERKFWRILVLFLSSLNYVFLNMRPPYAIWCEWIKRKRKTKVKTRSKIKRGRK